MEYFIDLETLKECEYVHVVAPYNVHTVYTIIAWLDSVTACCSCSLVDPS